MNKQQHFYAVHLHPQAMEVLGDIIKPYLAEPDTVPHIICSDVDTGGAFCECTLHGKNAEGKEIELELMIPTGMIRLIVSVNGDEGVFGFA
jgi:hypothetical protein